ncbi:MAG: von Willebrand factor type A domain-containing protein [Candidatus Zixiibacteriota bacterium]
MRQNLNRIGKLLLIAVLILPLVIMAGTKGKIKGTVTDKDTGKPITGATVQIVGTSQGAMTDPYGKYLIMLVKPDTSYTLRVSSVSYTTVEITSVSVLADQTTEINIEMESSVADLSNCTKVVEDRDIIRSLQLYSNVAMKKDEIDLRPVVNVDELLKQTAGVVTNEKGEILIRGGRAGEVSYIVDGVSIGDPLGGYGPNNFGLSLNNQSFERNETTSPAHGGNAIVNGETYDAMFFKDYGTNPFVDTEDDHLSTFAIDVDDASYIMTRSYLERGNLPPDEAVRVEEFVNHFKYDYEKPNGGPFNVNAEGGPSLFGTNSYLLKIGVQGMVIDEEERKPANLVFVIDVSGSMNREDRLQLVKRSLKMLVEHLNYDDEVGIVIYGSRGQVLLEPTSIRDERRIIWAIDELQPGGSTNAEEGLRLGYQMAERNFNRSKINRIILCSDGVANVGHTSPDDLLKEIKRYAERGITLTTVGFGMGNFNDILMEKLGNKGNGMYAYVDDFEESKRVFIKNLTGMLQVIAKDVKIQVDFSRDIVKSYRLLGYENRDVADNKFRDDREDGGEIGAGHQVTALYEIKFHDEPIHCSQHLATVFVRYKDPVTDQVEEVAGTITNSDFNHRFSSCSDDFRLAACAAEFAEILGKSYWAKDSRLEDVYNELRKLNNDEYSEELNELIKLVKKAQRLDGELSKR